MKYLILLFLFTAQTLVAQSSIHTGLWLGTLDLGVEKMPIRFSVAHKKGKYFFEIRNADEKIKVSEITQVGDSLCAKMPIFDSEFCLKIENEGKKLVGVWRNHARKDKNFLPFEADFQENTQNQLTKSKPHFSLAGKWEVHFSPNNPEDASPAIGEFFQTGNHVTGTFLTETGDYRFLEGDWNDAKAELRISCFDGSHAFLFTAKKEGEELRGKFYSGAHWQEEWTAKRNPNFTLRPADSLTFLKAGYEKMAFTFPDLNGKKVSLSDKKYENKVVLIQIMGSWCPNCMDETKLFTDWYKKYHNKGLEIIALSYEKTEDFAKASQNVQRLKTHFGAEYDFLIAGTSNKKAAATTLPMLNAIVAYPTAILIDRKGNIRNIYTGFSGPGTGKHYTEFVKEKETLIEELLGRF